MAALDGAAAAAAAAEVQLQPAMLHLRGMAQGLRPWRPAASAGPIACMSHAGDGQVLCGGPAGELRLLEVHPSRGVRPVRSARLQGSSNVAPAALVAPLASGDGRLCVLLWQEPHLLLSRLVAGQARVVRLAFGPWQTLGHAQAAAAHPRDGTLVAVGTAKGGLFCAALGGDTAIELGEDAEEVEEVEGPTGGDRPTAPHRVLLDARPGAAVTALHFVDCTENGERTLLAVGLESGRVQLYGPRGQGWAILGDVAVEASPVLALSAFEDVRGRVVLAAGFDSGAVLVWDAEALMEGSKGQADTLLASLGNFSGDPIHCLCAVEAEHPMVAVGDDAGVFSIYVGDAEGPSGPWRLSHRRQLGSPVVQACWMVGMGMFAVASCENGILVLGPDDVDAEPPREKRVTILEEPVAEEEEEEEEEEEAVESGSESEIEDDEVPPEPLPAPQPVARPESTPSAEPNCLPTTAEEEREAEEEQAERVAARRRRREKLAAERNAIDSDLEESESDTDWEGLEPSTAPHAPRAYPERPTEAPAHPAVDETCYHGMLDQDVPPLPHSIYAEPSLHSSEKIRAMLDKLRLAPLGPSPEDQAPEREPGAATPVLEEEAVSRSVAATQALTVPASARVYHGLAQIDCASELGDARVSAPRRVPAPQLSAGKRKSLLERQQEEMEKHRLERQAKALEALEAAALSEASKSSGGKRKASKARRAARPARQQEPEKQEQEQQDEAAAEAPAGGRAEAQPRLHASAPAWARSEFYLSRGDGGTVGFHHFRSLGQT